MPCVFLQQSTLWQVFTKESGTTRLQRPACQGSGRLINRRCEAEKLKRVVAVGGQHCLVISCFEAGQSAFYYGDLSGEKISSAAEECARLCFSEDPVCSPDSKSSLKVKYCFGDLIFITVASRLLHVGSNFTQDRRLNFSSPVVFLFITSTPARPSRGS